MMYWKADSQLERVVRNKRMSDVHLAKSDNLLLLRFRVDLDDTDRRTHSDGRALHDLAMLLASSMPNRALSTYIASDDDGITLGEAFQNLELARPDCIRHRILLLGL